MKKSGRMCQKLLIVVIIGLLGGVLVGFYSLAQTWTYLERGDPDWGTASVKQQGIFRLMTDENGAMPGQVVLGRTKK